MNRAPLVFPTSRIISQTFALSTTSCRPPLYYKLATCNQPLLAYHANVTYEMETSVTCPIQTWAFEAIPRLVSDLGYPIYSSPINEDKLGEAERRRAYRRSKLFKKGAFSLDRYLSTHTHTHTHTHTPLLNRLNKYKTTSRDSPHFTETKARKA